MKLKAILAIALTLALLMPTALADSPAMGRYVESSVPFPDEIEGIISVGGGSEGEIILYGGTETGYVRCVLDASLNWTVDKAADYDDTLSAGLVRTISEKDNRAVIMYHGGEEINYNSRLGILENGVFTPLKLDALYRDIRYMDGTALTGDGGVLASAYEQGVNCYDIETGEMRYSIPEVDGKFLTANGRLFAVSNRDGCVIRADEGTGENRDDLTGAPLTGDDFLAADKDSLYLANRTGIYRVAQTGSVWEKMVDGALCSLRLPSGEILGMAILDGDPVVVIYSDGGNKLLLFKYDENVQAVPSRELRVYTLTENPVLAQAASEFQNAHSDYLVSVTNLLADGAGATSDDVIRALNTELLAGGGPDVMLLDDMPFDSYIEKGVLADISGIINSLDLLDNVVSSFTKDGKVYSFPTSILLPVVIGTPENLDGVTNLDDAAKFCENWTGNNSAICKRTMSGYFDIFCPSCYNSWFEENGSLNAETFGQFLDNIKSIYASCGVETDEMGDEYDVYMLSAMGGSGQLFPSTTLMNGRAGREIDLVRVSRGESAIYPDVLSGFGLGMLELSLAESFAGSIIPLPGQSGSVYAPFGIVGVNAASAQLDAAYEFVRTTLDTGVQDVELYRGFPVNKKSVEKCVAKEDDRYTVGTSTYDDETGAEIELTGTWPSKETRDRVGELLSSAEVAYIPDNTLVNMIKEELSAFFEGREDSATACNRINSRLRAYLAE